MLLDILFIYCKLNPDTGYRQGMHEVLAPILWVISRDAIDKTDPSIKHEEQALTDRLVCECFDARFVEHDTFTLFGIIMQTVKSFYEVNSFTQVVPIASVNSSIVERSQRIHQVLLHQVDPELAEHLIAIEILPQIFLIRWIRLLFGREFPLDHVLALWDVLFAEDPSLGLIDLICVSMLLRIRWQLLNADYSEALTLLLRYPVPATPSDTSSFVGDALYLRQNLTHSGGDHIIKKYSEENLRDRRRGKASPSTPGRRIKQPRWTDAGGALSPAMAAARFLQEQKGIENIIQEAAKGVYSRGEKWGVNKALRGAIEGLQTGTNLTRRQIEGPRWSLDQGQHLPSVAQLVSHIESLEQRNTGLAKLLENAIAEVWTQQRQLSKEQEPLANSLSLSIARLQFVQVYLENPTMPFSVETSTLESADAVPDQKTAAHDSKEGADPRLSVEAKESSVSLIKDFNLVQQPESDQTSNLRRIAPSPPAPAIVASTSRPQPLPFHHPRPSLAQSSFSWMLGEDQRKSSFVSPSPFPSERRAAREKAGFLFGDGSQESEGTTQKKKEEDSEDEEVINMGTLKGRRKS
ncbi:MAG: hypothetical protein Q9220_001932 [cf. Caloplaca sp. 1 TL-2023]